MYDIYEKKIKSRYAGQGVESLIVKNDTILAHIRGWDDPTVVDDNWQSPLAGKPIKARGKGWRKLRGFKLENAQAWAKDML